MAQTWLSKYSTYEEEVTGTATAITAYAGGGQGSATAITSKFNSVDTCASDYDSVKLVAGLIGKKQYVFNNTVKILSIFPQSGENIDGTTNNEIKIFPGALAVFEAKESASWTSYGYDKYKKYSALLTQSSTDPPAASVLENTLGGTLVWTRNDVGDYSATLSNAFPSEAKMWFSVMNKNPFYEIIWLQWLDVSTINMFRLNASAALANDITGAHIEIRVYP